MADNDKVSFLLDLDIAEFTEKGLSAKGIIEKLGSAENMSGLLEGLVAVGPALAAAGIAAYAFKKAIDLTVEGEEIERVTHQFETLSKQAGIMPEELKTGLEGAAKGLIGTEDLLRIANEGIVKMGGSAEKLPQILELARKSTAVFGGDAKTNFEEITNAIANGNTRALKQHGIIIDLTKAEREFAEANGTTADQLSQTGKQQAILNAALQAGNEQFKGVKDNAASATSSLQRMKVIFSELGATFTLAFEKTIGPGMRSFLGTVENLATKLKLHVTASIGDAAEAAKAKAILAGKSIDEVSKQEEVQTQKSLQNIAKVSQASIIDQEKQKKAQAEFRKELNKIDQQYFTEQQKNVTSQSQFDQLIKKQTELLEKAHQANLQSIRANLSLTKHQKGMLEVTENKRFQEQMKHDEEEQLRLRMKLLDQYVANNKKGLGGIEAAFRANTQKMKLEQADFGKRGNEMWNSLSANATSAFTNMGAQMTQGKDLASSTADAMKGFFLGMLGDRAMAEGNLMLLSGIWPPNPVAIGGGIALLALGGALKSAAGSGGSATTAASGPSPQAISSGAAAPQTGTEAASSSSSGPSEAMPNVAAQSNAQRTVSVHIAGNYLETDQTKRMLMDLMRQESDATGFNYNQIGA